VTKPLALIVEDDPHLSHIFSITLSETFETETIVDGLHALERLKEVVPHLLVLDINLPGASGAQILREIRSDEQFAAVRIILATADSHQANDLQDKADIVLLKPISPSQLRDLSNRLK
jgi:two-component system response regulator MtrA